MPMADILPDVLQEGLRLVICGSAAGTVSARERAYYGHRQNRFWPTLAATGLTPRLFVPAAYASLPEYGIGLTDITKTEFGADAVLTSHDAERLRAALKRYRPTILAFNGKRAASLGLGRPSGSLAYGRLAEKLCDTPVFVLPSTSPLAVRWWDIAPWHELAATVREAG
jgi:double-stranded uracil-DNA glycosylase